MTLKDLSKAFLLAQGTIKGVIDRQCCSGNPRNMNFTGTLILSYHQHLNLWITGYKKTNILTLYVYSRQQSLPLGLCYWQLINQSEHSVIEKSPFLIEVKNMSGRRLMEMLERRMFLLKLMTRWQNFLRRRKDVWLLRRAED